MISLVEFLFFASLGTLTAAGASHGYQLLRQPRCRRSPVSSLPMQDEESSRPSSGAWHEPRRGPRHRMCCRIEYIHGDLCSIGTLVDISRKGWRVAGPNQVPRGTAVSAKLYLPDQPMPIIIDRAVVRWTDELEFGLELTKFQPASASRLSNYLATQFPVEQPEFLSTLSPFSYN